jgi:hypothetical protein
MQRDRAKLGNPDLDIRYVLSHLLVPEPAACCRTADHVEDAPDTMLLFLETGEPDAANPAVWAKSKSQIAPAFNGKPLASQENGVLQMSRMSRNVALFWGVTSATFSGRLRHSRNVLVNRGLRGNVDRCRFRSERGRRR